MTYLTVTQLRCSSSRSRLSRLGLPVGELRDLGSAGGSLRLPVGDGGDRGDGRGSDLRRH